MSGYTSYESPSAWVLNSIFLFFFENCVLFFHGPGSLTHKLYPPLLCLVSNIHSFGDSSFQDLIGKVIQYRTAQNYAGHSRLTLYQEISDKIRANEFGSNLASPLLQAIRSTSLYVNVTTVGRIPKLTLVSRGYDDT